MQIAVSMQRLGQCFHENKVLKLLMEAENPLRGCMASAQSKVQNVWIFQTPGLAG